MGFVGPVFAEHRKPGEWEWVRMVAWEYDSEFVIFNPTPMPHGSIGYLSSWYARYGIDGDPRRRFSASWTEHWWESAEFFVDALYPSDYVYVTTFMEDRDVDAAVRPQDPGSPGYLPFRIWNLYDPVYHRNVSYRLTQFDVDAWNRYALRQKLVYSQGIRRTEKQVIFGEERVDVTTAITDNVDESSLSFSDLEDDNVPFFDYAGYDALNPAPNNESRHVEFTSTVKQFDGDVESDVPELAGTSIVVSAKDLDGTELMLHFNNGDDGAEDALSGISVEVPLVLSVDELSCGLSYTDFYITMPETWVQNMGLDFRPLVFTFEHEDIENLRYKKQCFWMREFDPIPT